MIDPNDIIKLRDFVNKANDVLIVTHEKPSYDSVGSALALYLALSGIGKKVTVACPDQMTVELSGFIGVNKFVNEIRKKNFVISLDYVEGSIEKVSYNIEGDKFNLVIEPRAGLDTFSSDKVNFFRTGANTDLIIAVDTLRLEDLRDLYHGEIELFENRPVVNIDSHADNTNFGRLNFINSESVTTAEITAKILSALEVAFTADISTNIINAIYYETNNFRNSGVTAETFELVAACFKSGGRYFGRSKVDSSVNRVDNRAINQQAAQPQQVKTTVLKPVVQAEPQPLQKPLPKAKEAPADWLKPKIFKSTNTL